jgi:hypothetical protein
MGATAEQLSPEIVRELCFDPSSSAWLMSLLMRGLAPAWVINELVDMEDREGQYVEHRIELVRHASLTDAQWHKLADQDWVEVHESMILQPKSRCIPDGALREAQRQYDEFMLEGGFPSPDWHWGFLLPVIQEWMSDAYKVRVALVNSTTMRFQGTEVQPGETVGATLASLAQGAAGLATKPGVAADGVIWWYSRDGSLHAAEGYLVAADRRACRFVVKSGPGDMEWTFDDRVRRWSVDELEACHVMWKASALSMD